MVGVVPTFLNAMLKDMEKAGIIKDATNLSDSERAQAIKAVRDEYLAALMLSGSNRDKFGPLCMDLKDQFGFREDRYPKTIDQCLSLLNRWGHTPPASSNSPHTPWGVQTPTHDPKPEEALVFAQGSSSKKPSAKDSDDTSSKSSKSSKVSGSRQITSVRCKNCGKLGNTSLVCPDLMQSKPPLDHIHTMADIDDASDASEDSNVIILTQAETSSDCQPIDPDFVLLDSQSTVDLFSDLKHVQNICPAQLPIKVHCNKGTMSTAEVADFGDTQVYVNKDSIANVLSLFRLGQKYRITYDSYDRKGIFQVRTP